MANENLNDAIDVGKFNHYGNWIVKPSEIAPKMPFKQLEGDLYYLDRLPEDFEIVFSWIEKGAKNSPSFAGGMALYFNKQDFRKQKYSDAIECCFSDFIIRIHARESSESILEDSANGFTSDPPFTNFLKKPGETNNGKFICSKNTIQIVINDKLIRSIDLDKEIEDGGKAKIANKEDARTNECLVGSLKNIRSYKKTGLKMSIAWNAINANNETIITNLKINDLIGKKNGGLINIYEVNAETKWCANENGWSLESDKYYKKLANFAKNNAGNNRKYRPFSFQSFGEIKDIGATNNLFVIESLIYRMFYGDPKNSPKAKTIFIARLNDKYSTYVSVVKYDNKISCDENKVLLKNIKVNFLDRGEAVIESRENYLIEIINTSPERPPGFLDYAKNIIKIFD